jgi:hypothetical protein
MNKKQHDRIARYALVRIIGDMSRERVKSIPPHREELELLGDVEGTVYDEPKVTS